MNSNKVARFIIASAWFEDSESYKHSSQPDDKWVRDDPGAASRREHYAGRGDRARALALVHGGRLGMGVPGRGWAAAAVAEGPSGHPDKPGRGGGKQPPRSPNEFPAYP